MSLKKKVILGVVIAVIVLGTVGGIVAANTDTATTTEAVATNPQDTLLEKVAGKLGITVDSLNTAFSEARSELRQERLDAWLSELVADGKITQEQADAFKTWLDSRPSDQEYREALQAWRDANPLAGADIQLPGMGNFGGFDRGPCIGGRLGPMGGFGCR